MVRAPNLENDMAKPYVPRLERKSSPQGDPSEREDESDPLQENMPIVDDDEVSEEECERIGDLGNGEDGLDGVEALLSADGAGAPSRMALLMHRVAESLKALRALRSSPASPWTEDRVPEEHWRALADEALGIIGGAARRELSEQRLVKTIPEPQRRSFQGLCDSQRGLAVFQKQFDAERKEWEKAYWKRALDESFTKSPWRGPSGWRAGQ